MVTKNSVSELASLHSSMTMMTPNQLCVPCVPHIYTKSFTFCVSFGSTRSAQIFKQKHHLIQTITCRCEIQVHSELNRVYSSLPEQIRVPVVRPHFVVYQQTPAIIVTVLSSKLHTCEKRQHIVQPDTKFSQRFECFRVQCFAWNCASESRAMQFSLGVIAVT